MSDSANTWEFTPEESKRLAFFRDFVSKEQALEFSEILNSSEIPNSVEIPQTLADEIFVGTGALPKAIIKLLPEDFTRANEILEQRLETVTAEELTDHYLNQMSSEELNGLFAEPDKWSAEDLKVAEVILKGRGDDISEEEIKQKREERFAEIRKGRKGSRWWMLFYFLSIFLTIWVHIAFFIAGVGMGYYYAYGTSVDPDGNKYFVFEPQTRFYGKLLLWSGLLLFFIQLLIIISQLV